MYGAKTIALRDGYVIMNGQPKIPTWTQLAATSNVGENTLRLQGATNWLAGDLVVVASSSYFANETDEARITAATWDAATNVTTLTLDKTLNFTHLGVSIPVAGDPYGRVVDMRAEVAVLTRNVVIEGDDASEAALYGGHILVNTPRSRPRAQLQLQQIELRRMGQVGAAMCCHCIPRVLA
jgi:hypothetical protein